MPTRADLETRLRREFLANPAATENDWEAVKDQRVREHLLAEGSAADAQARRRSAQHARAAF